MLVQSPIPYSEAHLHFINTKPKIVYTSNEYKKIPANDTITAERNNLFANLKFIDNYQNSNAEQELETFKTKYKSLLISTFPDILKQANIESYEQKKEFEKVYESFVKTFTAQADQLQDAFNSGYEMLGFFKSFEEYVIKNQVDYHNANALILAMQMYVSMLPEKNKTKSRLINALKSLVEIKTKANILEIPQILPIENIVETALAFPVWFVGNSNKGHDTDQFFKKNSIPAKLQGMINVYSSQSGSYSSRRWAYGINDFEGQDVTPMDIAFNISKIEALFDFVVIGTPYHDLASKNWKSPAFWQRNIDPVLLGFINGCNYFVVIRRWSASGLFPRIPEMIADTMDHLKSNKSILATTMNIHQWGTNTLPGVLSKYNSGKLIEYLKS
jgi:uncharacterized UPF0160 family protein